MKNPANWIRWSARISRLVNRMRLKPRKKKIVGGSTARSSCSRTWPILAIRPGRLASIA